MGESENQGKDVFLRFSRSPFPRVLLFDMRIVSGSAGGLHLKVPRGHKTRPTVDQVREAIFNILTSRYQLEDIDVLDLFAGTGALGIEALSRGAHSAVFVDASPDAQRTIKENLT